MANYSFGLDHLSQLQTGLQNTTTLLRDTFVLNTVKTFVHSGAFVITGIFTYLIVAAVRSTAELQRSARYVLLGQHCVCVMGFNGAGAVLHCLRALRLQTPRLVCWLVFDLQVLLARGLVITLTLMAMNTSLSICRPLRYSALLHRIRRPMLLLAWALALANPLVFTVLACVHSTWEHIVGPDPECSTVLEGTASRSSALMLLTVLIVLIIASYVMIYCEARRGGHFSQSNRRGRRTVLIHSLQISLHLLPSIIIICRLQQSLAVAVANFVVFCVAQSLSPVVYGLCCRELREHLPHTHHKSQPCRVMRVFENDEQSSIRNHH